MQRIFIIIFISVASWIALADVACAAGRPGTGFARDFGADHFAAGRSVDIDTDVAGDAIAAGGEVTLSSAVSGDAVLAGRDVRIDGDTGASVYAAGREVAIESSVGRNVRIAGTIVDIGRHAQIGGNASIAGAHVEVDGAIEGYLQVAGGRVYIDGTVGGDVEVHAREVVLGPNARIDGALRYRSPNALEQNAHAVVGGGIERLTMHEPTSGVHVMRHIGRGIWTVGLMIVAVLLAAATPSFSMRVSERVRQHFLLSLLLAFAVIVGVPVAAILLFATGIGAPLGMMAILAYPILLLLGYVSAGVASGDAVLRRIKPNHVMNKRWRAVFAALGVLVISLLAWLPWVGHYVALIAVLAGVGSLVFQPWAVASER